MITVFENHSKCCILAKIGLARGVQPTLSILSFLLRKKSSITSTIHDICPSAQVQ